MTSQTELELIADVASIKKDVSLLRNELLGNGQPGKMKLAEDAIAELQAKREFNAGAVYSRTVILSVIFSGLMELIAHGNALWRLLFSVSASQHH